MFFDNLGLEWAIIIFIISAVVIAIAGTRLAKTADQLADLTGMGEAIFGAVFLGGVTSLPGIVTSVTAAINNHPELAISNAIGGIAAQTVFLSIADISYTKANLEHAAASFANLMQGVLLILLLSFIIFLTTGPDISFWGIHPGSIILLVAYIAGTKLISKAKKTPMWNPTKTKFTIKDEPDKENEKLSLKKSIIIFVVLAIVVAAAGYSVAKTGIIISENTGLSETLVGSLFTAVATSLPELIVSIAGVRQGAVTLAVANIIGGNTFDMLFVAFSDFAYLEGSIYHSLSDDQDFIISMTIIMTSVTLLGLLHRQQKGPAKIGWESILVLIIFVLGYLYLFFD
ncbi:MAG: sodium:calcium antiporter [Cyclobacteriaceae bacterium]